MATKTKTTEKIFIGSVKPGSFHTPSEGEIDLKIFLGSKDVAKIIKYAKDEGPGTWTTKEGEKMVNLRLKTSQSGKMYMEIDTWVPDQSNAKAPVEEAEIVEEYDDDDLPF